MISGQTKTRASVEKKNYDLSINNDFENSESVVVRNNSARLL